MTVLKPPNGPLCTCLTIRQTGFTGWGAARAGKDAAPVTASRAAVAAATRRTMRRTGLRPR